MAAHSTGVACCTASAAEDARAAGLTLVCQTEDSDDQTTSWLVADSADAVADAQLLHGATSYLSMLHDSERNSAYEDGLRHLYEKESVDGKRGRTILDLGSGTGLLAMMACQIFPESRAVGCEIYGPMATLANKLAEVNGLADRVLVVNKLASDLEVGVDFPEPADVCVFELFDSQLLGESILPILRDAHYRLLKPGAHMVPQSVHLHAMLVQCCPSLSWADLPELRGAPWPIMTTQLDDTVLRPLSAPWRAATISFASLPSSGPHVTVTEVAVTVSGMAHGVVWWWELNMGGGTRLSNLRPALRTRSSTPAAHHWRPCISFMAPLSVERGTLAKVAQVHDDDAVWFAWHQLDIDIPPRWVEGLNKIPAERDRLIMAHSEAWMAAMRSAAAAAAATSMDVNNKVLLAPAEDGLTLPLFATTMSTTRTSYMINLHTRIARRLQRDGLLSGDISLFSSEDVCEGSPKFASALVEPFFNGVVNPWSIASICRTRLEELRPFLAPAATCLPSAVSIMVMAVECESVWLARQRLSNICRIDMRDANAFLVPTHVSPLDCSFCELAWRPLSDPVELLRIDMDTCGPWCGSVALVPTAHGVCHGIGMWCEIELGEALLSTGPPPPGSAPTGWTQSIGLVDRPIVFTLQGSAEGACCVEADLSTRGDFHLKIAEIGGAKRRKI